MTPGVRPGDQAGPAGPWEAGGMVGTLMLVRHGESVANARSLFTGVLDVGLTPSGIRDCSLAGSRLRRVGFRPDALITSELVRGWRTAELICEEIGFPGTIERDWHLNERNYGALSGLSKAQVRIEHGAERFRLWRRSYAGRPPPLPERTLALWRTLSPFDRLPPEALTATESLQDVVERIRPWWYQMLTPRLIDGEDVLVVGHGNSLRALCAVIGDLDDEELSALNLPNARPLRYRFAVGAGPSSAAPHRAGAEPLAGVGPGTDADPGRSITPGSPDPLLAPETRGGEYLDPEAAQREAALIAAQGGT
ncbi:2,3-bisphosphoglycerate-dependent phosphoglycerate mutase [Pseudactinotalea sp. Z1739]|uniref:2,3-bisphosphoglycerate-dependent phosphoglycerate mutase n=1 Tax=Pseudactinotalea sp. Z1739 TaxID=3413028 RepID=UPI003C7B0D69